MQYYKILCGCRIPGKKKDTWVCYPPDEANPPRHLVIAHNNAVRKFSEWMKKPLYQLNAVFYNFLLLISTFVLVFWNNNNIRHSDGLKILNHFQWSFGDFSESLPIDIQGKSCFK